MSETTVSAKQLAANRQNAQKGGPKTEAGKAKVAQNATKHGVLSQTLIINTGLVQESEEEFEELKQATFELLKPQNKAEEEVVTEIVFCMWKKRRLHRAEAGEIKKRNAYLSDNVRRKQWKDEKMEIATEFINLPERDLEYQLDRIKDTYQLYNCLKACLNEYKANGELSKASYRTASSVLKHDRDLLNRLGALTSRQKNSEKDENLAWIEKRLSFYERRLAYLYVRNDNQQLHESEANYVPSGKVVDRLMKYGATIDKQIRNSMKLLKILRGETDVDEDKPLPINS